MLVVSNGWNGGQIIKVLLALMPTCMICHQAIQRLLLPSYFKNGKWWSSSTFILFAFSSHYYSSVCLLWSHSIWIDFSEAKQYLWDGIRTRVLWTPFDRLGHSAWSQKISTLTLFVTSISISKLFGNFFLFSPDLMPGWNFRKTIKRRSKQRFINFAT